MTLAIVPATPEHAAALAPDMREEEVLEVRAALDLGPEEALLKLMRSSLFSCAVYFDGELCTIFGIIEAIDGAGFPWLLSSTAVERHPLAFWRTSKDVLARMRRLFPVLVQFVDARYTRCHSWAQRLGFTLGPAEPHGVAGLPFHPLAIRGL